MARKKKKIIHWSKLPRAKLVSMVKRLQSEKTKLQLQLSQARETKLLNERPRETMRDAPADFQCSCGRGAEPCPNAEGMPLCVVASHAPDPLSGTALDDALERNAPPAFPWEQK